MTGQDVLSTAKKELGVTESPEGSNRVKYNTWFYGKEVSGNGYPWCMAFVQWVYAQAGYKLPCATASCSALLNWYKKNKPHCVVSKPQAGDIVLYNFGHCGIVESLKGTSLAAIEGNTSAGDKGSQDNGGGVFRRTRKTSLVTGYLRPLAENAAPAYTVKRGDSLWSIAAKQLGNGARFEEIKKLNGLTNNTIHAGQTLKLPERGTK